MGYRTLRDTGATASRLCLSIIIFGQQADASTSERILDMALAAAFFPFDGGMTA